MSESFFLFSEDSRGAPLPPPCTFGNEAHDERKIAGAKIAPFVLDTGGVGTVGCDSREVSVRYDA